jgi:SAM-dependent methyltransferase
MLGSSAYSLLRRVKQRIAGPRSAPSAALGHSFPAAQIEEALPELRAEFQSLQYGGLALQKLIDDYQFSSVLDIGCGAGSQSDIFAAHGKVVTAIDYGLSPYFDERESGVVRIVADFNTYDFSDVFDCIWCSHVLEHQLNPGIFLLLLHTLLKEEGVLAVTVPPLKHEIVGGHVSLWNAGLVLYHLILAGFDCRDASVLSYGYNISVIVRKHSIGTLPNLGFDAGDIRKLRPFFPEGLHHTPNALDDPFDGNISRLNW